MKEEDGEKERTDGEGGIRSVYGRIGADGEGVVWKLRRTENSDCECRGAG